MASDFPYVYPNSRAEAHRRKETQMHEDSFRLNVDCARAIEQAIRDHYDEADKSLTEDCARSVLEKFGFKRVNFVLANSLLEFQKSINCKHLVSDETYQWGRRVSAHSRGCGQWQLHHRPAARHERKRRQRSFHRQWSTLRPRLVHGDGDRLPEHRLLHRVHRGHR